MTENVETKSPPTAAENRMRVRSAKVLNAWMLTPRVRRIVMALQKGDDLGEVYPGQWIKILLPDSKEDRSLGRAYTIRHYDVPRAELTLDLILHEHGPGAEWGRRLEIGNAVSFLGPAGDFRIDSTAPGYLFAVDETALPAVASIVEHLHTDKPVRLVIEISDREEIQQINTSSQLDIRWLCRNDFASERVSPLEEALRSVELSSSGGQIFVAGETSAVRRICKYLLTERNVPRHLLHASGYWKRGEAAQRDPDSDY